jgi:hypothetical protein
LDNSALNSDVDTTRLATLSAATTQKTRTTARRRRSREPSMRVDRLEMPRRSTSVNDVADVPLACWLPEPLECTLPARPPRMEPARPPPPTALPASSRSAAMDALRDVDDSAGGLDFVAVVVVVMVVAAPARVAAPAPSSWLSPSSFFLRYAPPP